MLCTNEKKSIIENEYSEFLDSIEYKDFIVYKNDVYVNIDENPNKEFLLDTINSEYGGELLKSGDLGSVINRDEEAVLNKQSSALPTGTKIYKYYVSNDMILAEIDDKLILYANVHEDYHFTIYSPEISPNFEDFVVFDGILYSNIAYEPSWIALGYKYIKGDFFGEVLANSDERNIYRIENGTANFTPVGTKFYRFDEDPTIILADTPNGLIPFLMIVEG
jgi:hypothetical protein